MISLRTEVAERIYREAMMSCIKPWYTDDCRSCKSEFITCLSNYLSLLN